MKLKKILLAFIGIALAIPASLFLTGCQSKPRVSPNTLCLQFNDFLEETEEDGTREQLISEWFSLESETRTVDYQSLQNINGTLRVGILDGTVPFTFVGSNGYTGLLIEMITRFCREYGYGVRFDAYNGVGPLISALTADNCDMAATSLTITEEREKAVMFSKPYMNDETGIMIRKEDASTIKKVEDLKDKTIGIESGGMFGEMVKTLADNVNVLEFSGVADLCLALESKVIDAAVSDGSSLTFAALHHPTLTTFTQHLLDNFLGIAFKKTTYTKFYELNGKNIGIFGEDEIEDTICGIIDSPKFKKYSYADEEIIRRDLQSGTIDAAVCYTDTARYEASSSPNPPSFGIIAEPVSSIKGTMAFPISVEGKMFLSHFNDFIALPENKYLSRRITRNWTNNSSYDLNIPDYRTLPATNGLLKVGIDPVFAPYSFLENGVYKGAFVDLLSLYAEANGFGLSFVNCTIYDVEKYLSEGKINCYVNIEVLPEDGETYMLSNPFGESYLNLIVRDSYAARQSFFDMVATNFKKTFIVEDRYRTFVDGIVTTLIITVASIAIGLILGFLVFILLRNTNKVTSIIYKILEFLISGTPAVVLLMIFYYIFFAGSDVPAIMVSVVAFSFIFMCGTVTMLRTGFSSIDKGQSEAAFTLGYSRSKTFFKILLPQASKTFMPLLKGNIIEHIKGTAIVGYIAIVDLTKATEIVRSRTFDAFFSLIATTILYFLVEYLFVFLLKLIPVDPKKRKSINVLKGVNSHD